MAHESLAQDRPAPVDRHVSAADAEVLCAPDCLADAAAAALGWDGVVLAPIALLGRRVVVVAELIEDVHEQRTRSGWRPVTDRVSVSLWDWPEMRHLTPPPAVRLRGVLAPARHWRTALAGTAPFAGLCATAVLLPAHIARAADCLAHAAHHGPTVLAAAGPHDIDPEAVDVVQVGRSGPTAPAPGNVVSRWVHEIVYDRLLRRP
ncbi:MAG: hypothetical protein ACRDQD_28605 [Nocardioidaceae bacterium]